MDMNVIRICRRHEPNANRLTKKLEGSPWVWMFLRSQVYNETFITMFKALMDICQEDHDSMAATKRSSKDLKDIQKTLARRRSRVISSFSQDLARRWEVAGRRRQEVSYPFGPEPPVVRLKVSIAIWEGSTARKHFFASGRRPF